MLIAFGLCYVNDQYRGTVQDNKSRTPLLDDNEENASEDVGLDKV